MKQHRLILIFISVLGLVILVVISFLISLVFQALSWKTFVFPMIAWVILLPFYLLYFKIKVSKNYKIKLATSEWMDPNVFSYKFPLVNYKSIYQAHWLAKTKLTAGSLNFSQVKVKAHALVIGSTGSGKTSLLLNPTIISFAHSQTKPTMIFSDPKGELFHNHSKFLQSQGYEILCLNLRDYQRSKHWNPLNHIWDLWFAKNNQEFAREQALTYLAELTASIFPPVKNNDTFFDDAAFSAFQFFVILYLEKAARDQDLNREQFNINNIVANINQTTYDDLQVELNSLSASSLALSIGGVHVRGADKTVTNILQTVVTKLKVYTDPVIKRITANTNLNINLDKPQAIFIIVPDESPAKYPFISLFTSEFYKELVNLASQSEPASLSRPVYFLLDEFGNIPKIPQIASMVTVARSRNIFFMLLIQNYSQLIEKYGPHVANTIISNCALEYYLLTSDVETAKKFSQKLGQKSLIARSRSNSSNLKGASSSSSESERTRQLIHPDELMRLAFGEFVLSLQREKPIKSTLAKFWEWKNFKPAKIDLPALAETNYQAKYATNFINQPQIIDQPINQQETKQQKQNLKSNNDKMWQNIKLQIDAESEREQND